MIKVFLNDVEVTNNAEIDFSYVEKLDRELDEGFIVLSHVNEANQYPMFSVIDIYEDETLVFSGRISRDSVELSSFSDLIYNHNITLIEHTKLLEKFLVNGKTFTQPIRNQDYEPYTLFDVVDILRKTAVFERNGFEEIFSPFIIPQELEDELKEIIAPELTFKDLTLRQALDEVANYLNAISRLDRNKNLIFDKFNELINPITQITESYKKQQNIEGYSTYLSSDAINPINNAKSLDNYNNFEYYPSKSLWTTLRSDFGQFDFSNSVIPTPKPIYDVMGVETVIKLEVVKETGSYSGSQFTVTNTTTEIDSDFYVLDITDNVVEKKEYDILEELPSSFEKRLNKRNAIFFNYGKKGIQMGQTFGIFDIQQSFPFVIQSVLVKNIVESYLPMTETGSYSFQGELSSGYLEFWGLGDNDDTRILIKYELMGNIDEFISFSRWKTLFRVKYIPLPPSIRYEVVRDDLTEVDLFTYNTINQKMRMVDLQSFSDNMKGRINQLGESQLQLSHKVKQISQSWNLGDFTQESFIVTKKEVIAQRDHYIINYELNRNFNKISQFMGVDQEVRQWEIGESGRTLDRDLNYNEFIEVYSTVTDTFDYDEAQVTIKSNSLFLDTFDNNKSSSPIDFGVFNAEGILIDGLESYSLLVPIYKLSGGDAFGFYFDFETNASAGNELELGDSAYAVELLQSVADDVFGTSSFGRYYNVPVKYTGEVGRLETFNISIFNEDLTENIPDFESETQDANILPKLSKNVTEDSLVSSDFYVAKDNRERLKFTMLYHLSSKDLEDVIIGERLATHNSYITTDKKNIELRLFNDRKFTNRDKQSKLDDFDSKITSNFLSISSVNSYIEITEDLSNIDAWALTDGDGYPYIMVNNNNPRVVFEFNNKKSTIDYGFDNPPNVLKRPTIVQRTSNSNSISIRLGNPNSEKVEIQVTSGETVKTLEVEQNTTSEIFVFDNLEPNLNYSFSSKCLPLGDSVNLESSTINFNKQTEIISLTPPTFVFDSVEDGDSVDKGYINGTLQPIDPPVTAKIVKYEVFNNNSVEVLVNTELNGEDVTSITTITRIQPNSSEILPLERKYSDPVTLVPDTNTITADTRIMPQTDYEFRLRFLTSEFNNNWFSNYSPIEEFNIALPPAVSPNLTWTPTSTENQLIFNVDNEQNYNIKVSGTLRLNDEFVEPLSEITIPANTNENITYVNTTNENIPNNLDAFDEFKLTLGTIAATGFALGSPVSATGRFAGEAKPPTYQFVSKTSTNSTSSFTYKLTNIERYQGRIYYEANTFANGFTPTNYEIVDSGQSITRTFEVPANNIDDLHYVHFYMAEDGPLQDIPEVIDDSVIVISPSITPEPYIDQFTVNFLDIDGNVIETILKDDGENLQIGDFPGAPSESGYTFVDWYDSAQLTNVVTTGYTITSNLDVYPRYDIITYNITYELDGATNDASNPSTYTVEDTFTLQPASRVGYDFDGWYSDSLLTSEVTTIQEGTTGNLTLYAKLDRLFLEDVVFELIDSTFTSLTIRATNPSNQRSDANVGFWLSLYEGSTQVESNTQYIFTEAGDTIDIIYENLDDNTEYTLASSFPPEEIEVFDTNNIYDDLLLPTQNVTTPEIIGDKVLEVILNTQSLGSESATFNYNVDGVPQSSESVNNSSYTTIRSNLFDDDLVHLFAPSLSGFSFSNFIINGEQFNDQSPEVLVDQGLTVEIVYT